MLTTMLMFGRTLGVSVLLYNHCSVCPDTVWSSSCHHHAHRCISLSMEQFLFSPDYVLERNYGEVTKSDFVKPRHNL